MKSLQIPFTQGASIHSSTGSTSHNLPVNGGGQEHVKLSIASTQVPSFTQGLGLQCPINTSQLVPL